MKTLSPAQQKIKALLEQRRASIPTPVPAHTPVPTGTHISTTLLSDPDQQRAQELALAGKSFVLTGAAGTGKTTTVVDRIIANLIKQNKLGVMPRSGHKYLMPGSPSIVAVSFTNKAVENIRNKVSTDLKRNCMTLHKLLEFAPVVEEVWDADSGTDKKTMTFLPSRDEYNPLPPIDVLLIDEATMVSIPLSNQLADAIASNTQIIIIGDIHQLPPVFGKSIFIWAMQMGLPIVELSTVYRQALKSPIIALATHIREGKMIPAPQLENFSKETPEGKVFIRPWKKSLSDTVALRTVNEILFPELIDSGTYRPLEDVVLTPFNVSFGTVAMNAAIAELLKQREPDSEKKKVQEIFAGIKKKYFRVGDKVLYNKSEAIITKIKKNPSYIGKPARDASETLNYKGIESDKDKDLEYLAKLGSASDLDVDLMHIMDHTDDESPTSQQASHRVFLSLRDADTDDLDVELSTAGEIGNLDLGYAITVHKAQGSEYERVFFITHKSQGSMLFRELIYTAVTRAKKELYIVCEPNMFVKGVTSQRIPGNTLEEKLENFERQLSLTKPSESEIPSARLKELLL